MTGASLTFIKTLFEERNTDPMEGQLLHHANRRTAPNAQHLVKLLMMKRLPVDKIKYGDDESSINERRQLGLGTTLHRAAELGKLAIVSNSFEADANHFTLGTKGEKAIYWAHKNDHRDAERFLQSAEETCTSYLPIA